MLGTCHPASATDRAAQHDLQGCGPCVCFHALRSTSPTPDDMGSRLASTWCRRRTAGRSRKVTTRHPWFRPASAWSRRSTTTGHNGVRSTSHKPPFTLPWMPPKGPTPECFEGGAVDTAENARALDVAVIHRATPDHSVEVCYQPPCRSMQRLPQMESHVLKGRTNVLLGRLDPQLAMAVATHVLAKEVEFLFDVRDLRLFR